MRKHFSKHFLSARSNVRHAELLTQVQVRTEGAHVLQVLHVDEAWSAVSGPAGPCLTPLLELELHRVAAQDAIFSTSLSAPLTSLRKTISQVG